jgi:predicted phosphodiesterase
VRILILSDIHANLEALEACLQSAPEHDAVVNLGDIVGYGASPNEVIDRVRSLGSIFVRGNHDKACSGVAPMDDFNPIAAMAVIWTRTMLRPENLAWLRALPEGPAQVDGVDNVQFVHGSPLDEDDYVLMLHDALGPMRTLPVPVTFFGHSHVQGGFMLQDGQGATLKPVYRSSERTEKFELELAPGAHYMINPGSVGQPRDGDWRAAFVLFDSDSSTVTYYRVPYLIDQAQQRILNAQLPERLATRLALGR